MFVGEMDTGSYVLGDKGSELEVNDSLNLGAARFRVHGMYIPPPTSNRIGLRKRQFRVSLIQPTLAQTITFLTGRLNIEVSKPVGCSVRLRPTTWFLHVSRGMDR